MTRSRSASQRPAAPEPASLVAWELPRLPGEVDHCRFCGASLTHNRDFTAWAGICAANPHGVDHAAESRLVWLPRMG